MRFLLAVVISLVSCSAAWALPPDLQACKYLGEVCVEGAGTRYFSGVPLYKSCWRWRKSYSCVPTAEFNHCLGLQAAPECTQASSTCVQNHPITGECVQWRQIFGCNGVQPTNSNVIDVGPTYTVVRDEQVSQCGEHETNPNCQLQGETCTEGPETRVINGLPVYKDCWKWDRDYACFTGVNKNNCEELAANCTWAFDTCLAEDSAGNCVTTERTYRCQQNPAPTPGGPGPVECQEAVYCINGECETVQRVANGDFHKAITWLSALKGMADEFDEGTLSVFKGEHMECGVTIVGFSNCCKDSGWGSDIGLAECSEEELMLAEKMQARLGVYVGTYCDKKVIGVCVEKKRSYCVFSSRLGRIINEQGRPQLGRGWGAPKSPDCAGLTINDLQSIDFSQIDLTELYADVQANIPDVAATTQEMTNRIRSRYE